MESENGVSPRDFPILFPMRVVRKWKSKPPGYWGRCSVCHLAVSNRNRNRHVKACRRRKRLAPNLWAAWKKDMNA